MKNEAAEGPLCARGHAPAGVATLYVDGRAVATGANTTAPSGSSTFYIGYGTLASWFNGYVTEASYYGQALSADRVLDHFQADPPPALRYAHLAVHKTIKRHTKRSRHHRHHHSR